MKYELIKQLIAYAEAFEQQMPAEEQHTALNFTAWLSQRLAAQPDQVADGSDSPDPTNLLGQADSPDTLISIMVSYLYRYTRLYSRRVLADTPLTTIDEFSYMVMLLEEGPPPTKTDLIERNIHEKTTGIAILSRLLKAGLIEQFDDLTDRRSKRLKLTGYGIGVMVELLPRMGKLVTLVGGNLLPTEKVQLAYLLTKLHLFHNQLFIDEHQTPVETLTDRLSNTNN